MEKSNSIEADINLKLMINSTENGDIPTLENNQLKLSFCQKFKFIFTNITIEPIMICYVIPTVMGSIASQNLSLEKACRVNLKLNESICDALTARNASGYNTSDEAAVQKAVSTLNAYKNILQSVLPTLLLMFIGSWSDRYNRRKPCILLPVFGEVLCCIGLLICIYFFYELPMEFNLLAEGIPPCLTGGWFCLFMGVFSYISGISTIEDRTVRIGAVSVFCEVSMTIGIALSGILFKETGFYGVFGLSLIMYSFGLVYGYFRVHEMPLKIEEVSEEIVAINNKRKRNALVDFFDVKHISETFKVAFKDGKQNRKKRICLIMLLVMIIVGPAHGELNVRYLFVRYKFGWNEMDYSIYSTFNFVACLIGVIVSLWFFLKILKVDDTILGIISTISKIASAIVFAYAPNGMVFYIGAIVEAWNATSFIALRSIISKLVPPDELGKVSSLFGVSEALIPLIYGPIYSFVYNNTLDSMPGAFFLLGGILTAPGLLIFIWLYNEHKKDAIEEKEKSKLLQKQKN